MISTIKPGMRGRTKPFEDVQKFLRENGLGPAAKMHYDKEFEVLRTHHPVLISVRLLYNNRVVSFYPEEVEVSNGFSKIYD